MTTAAHVVVELERAERTVTALMQSLLPRADDPGAEGAAFARGMLLAYGNSLEEIGRALSVARDAAAADDGH